ncbi:DUF2069 domain-containing protein [Alteromonas sediminis]|uniref:DUF2069 domain-containing protein n=2 Tax=Alteromonas sediminis TaxID=2259342 RepID=A0A3N5Y2W2_9ALTE|nr:DUF2069 domain-containing protein [Alteromonas sediminis]RPJ67680.1 DUF2069 domain-containing protein [Alteromonas sediminis]
MANKTKFYRYVALLSHLALLLWVANWQLLVTKEHAYSVPFVVLIYLMPLLLPLHGILRGKAYTHAWANFFILFYFLHSITVLYAVPAERVYAAVELVLAVAMFTGCCVFARLRGRECGLGIGKLKDEMEREKQHFEQR